MQGTHAHMHMIGQYLLRHILKAGKTLIACSQAAEEEGPHQLWTHFLLFHFPVFGLLEVMCVAQNESHNYSIAVMGLNVEIVINKNACWLSHHSGHPASC